MIPNGQIKFVHGIKNMKQKLVMFLAISFLAVMAFSQKALAAEGDVWITPTNQNVETSQHFDIEVHVDTGGKTLGAFNMYFDFTAANLTVDTALGTDGMDKGADATNYNVMANPGDIANGHFRFAGIAASGGANNANAHLVTIHAVSTAAFTSGTSNMTLRVNEMSNELGVAFATGTITGATITYLAGDTTPPILSSGAPTGTLNAGTTTATISLTTSEAATCKYDTTSGVAYASMANTFTTTGGTSQSEDLTGLVNGTDYNFYVRCSDAGSHVNTSDYLISFDTDSPPTNITLANASINEGIAINTTVGALTTTDPDSGDTFTYSLACATPGADDASFNISSANLRSSAVFDYETKSSYAICIRTTDNHSGTFDKNFTVTVNNLDDTAPVVAQVTPVATPTIDNTPDYVFSSTEVGTITYGGDCSSADTSASVDNNTITFNELSDGVHNNCTIVVTDANSNASNALAVTSFTVDATVPTITSVSSSKANGAYTTGEVIDIDVTFSENVTSTGDITVTLETGTTDRSCTFTVAGASAGTCNYTVQSGDVSSDLTVKEITVAGAINDASANAIVNFVPTTNLAANKALVIDTTSPVITVNESTDAGPTGDDTINLTASDTNLDTSSLRYGFSTDNICNGSDTYGTAFTNSADFHITTAHADYLCAQAEDNANNASYQLVGQLNVADVSGPVLSAGEPSGILVVGTANTTLTLTTDEAAICKYDTTSGAAYASMANTFTTTGGTSQSQDISGLTNGADYIYYVKCRDGLNNTNANDYTISFSVASESVQDQDDDDSVDVDTLASTISSPYAKIANFIKEKIKNGKTLYSKKKEFSFKGEDVSLAGGTVKLFEGSDEKDDDVIGADGKWKLDVDEDDNKTYEYKIKYYNASGVQIESKKYKVKIDSKNSEFTDLPAKLHKSKGGSIWWKAKDNVEIKKFKVTFNGKIYTINASKNGSDEEIKTIFNIPADIASGIHAMSVKSYDKAGNTTTAHVDVSIR
ncbi:MAG: outer membrane protein domain-containing protein [Candidatus Moranbacteria bacterium GW2011_GWE1_35_17]|nr:MAG: outer membrane protein domain-containing protein [Candidatus Moranbacteria bacterium GW2011_GWE1_35_17]